MFPLCLFPSKIVLSAKECWVFYKDNRRLSIRKGVITQLPIALGPINLILILAQLKHKNRLITENSRLYGSQMLWCELTPNFDDSWLLTDGPRANRIPHVFEDPKTQLYKVQAPSSSRQVADCDWSLVSPRTQMNFYQPPYFLKIWRGPISTIMISSQPNI